MRVPIHLVVVGLALLVAGATSVAFAGAEERCQGNRYLAAALHARCQLKAVAKYHATGAQDVPKYQEAGAKCAARYDFLWRRLQTRALGSGSSCDGSRFMDRGDGTVTDRLTGLQWEKKTDDGSIHDRDDRLSWTATGVAADGPVFATFLAGLNGACFAGHCDWRLPTLTELQTILLGQYPEGGIDAVFGPVGDYYWTATEQTNGPDVAWVLSFLDGSRAVVDKATTFGVRAVRGGL